MQHEWTWSATGKETDMTTDTDSGPDLLYGVRRIAAFLGIGVKATYHLVFAACFATAMGRCCRMTMRAART